MKKILCILFCLLPVLGGKAQTLYRDQVRIEKESITRSEDNNVLTINLDIVLQENETADARWVTLEKFIQMGEDGTLAEPVYRRFRQFEEACWKLIKNEGEEKKHENL